MSVKKSVVFLLVTLLIVVLMGINLAAVSAASAWAPNVAYKVGDQVTYNGLYYQCLQAHTSLVGWEPPNVPALWQQIATPSGTVTPTATKTATPTATPTVTPTTTKTPTTTPTATKTATPTATPTATKTPTPTPTSTGGNFPAWTYPHTYAVGDIVSYNGVNYQCIYAHTSNVAWTPDATPTLWKVYTGGPTARPSVTPTPTNTATPTATASNPPPVTGLPKHIMSGYWHTWNSGCPFIPLANVDPNWDVINVSFAAPVNPGSGDGQMTFSVPGDGNYTDAQFKADIKTLQARGKKIVLSIGGYTGYFSLLSSGAVTTFVNAINGYINTYGFDGIDIDLEQTSLTFNAGADPDFKNPTSPSVVNLISALKSITGSRGSNFILSFAPETFYLQLGYQFYAGLNAAVDNRAGVQIPVIYALRDKVTYVQAQLYNSGPIMGLDGTSHTFGDAASIVAMCDMLIKGFNCGGNASYFFPGLRADQVVIGVPASGSAAGSGQVSNATLQQAFNTLRASYPTLRGIMAWSINWDSFQNSNSFVDGNKAYLNSIP